MKGSIVLLVALAGGAGQAATVTTTADDGPGSLRQAIASAASGETITFSIGRTVPGREPRIEGREGRRHRPQPVVITLTSGQLVLDKDLTIAGPGASLLTIQRSTNADTPAFRIFYHPSGTATISGLTLCNGKTDLGGAAIRSFTAMIVRDCIIARNSTSGVGGGIRIDGSFAITNSVIISNEAIYGGGVFTEGPLTVDTSTIASNSAVWGGGIFNDLGTTTLVGSTVSGNVAQSSGGIVNEGGLARLENSTIGGNIAGGVSSGPYTATGLDNCTVVGNVGGGIYNFLAFVALKNTIVAANTAAPDLETGPHFGDEPQPKTISLGFNVIGSTNGTMTPGPNDQFNVSTEALKLGPLQDNGGPTFTHQLLCGSVAINAGANDDAPDTDQRGFPRIMGGTIDIGAYESGNQPGEVVNTDGCTIADLCPCDASWRNHGQYVECVAQQTAAFVAQDLMTEAARGRAIRAAAHSDCGARDEPFRPRAEPDGSREQRNNKQEQ